MAIHSTDSTMSQYIIPPDRFLTTFTSPQPNSTGDIPSLGSSLSQISSIKCKTLLIQQLLRQMELGYSPNAPVRIFTTPFISHKPLWNSESWRIARIIPNDTVVSFLWKCLNHVVLFKRTLEYHLVCKYCQDFTSLNHIQGFDQTNTTQRFHPHNDWFTDVDGDWKQLETTSSVCPICIMFDQHDGHFTNHPIITPSFILTPCSEESSLVISVSLIKLNGLNPHLETIAQSTELSNVSHQPD